jgi:predicted nuclease of predicted toxin-antitoxin system
MRFLVDASLPPALAASLKEAGHDAVFLTEIGSPSASDPQVIELARRDKRIITADADFSTQLALSGEATPSIVFYRRTRARRASQLSLLLLAQLARVEQELNQGAVVVIEEGRVRVRSLPIERS